MVAALDYIAYVNAHNGCFDENIEGIFSAGRSVNDTNLCLIPVVYFSDSLLRNEIRQAIHDHPNRPRVLAQRFEEQFTPELVNNQTLFAAIDAGGSIISHLHVEVDLDRWLVRNFTFSAIDLLNFPSKFKDDEYNQDMEYLSTLADEALANDPIVGTTGFMPLTRTVSESDWRMCMGGECPIGNLFTDALKWTANADFAVINSGGLRGEGWEAGEVYFSDIWVRLKQFGCVS
jgi:2',3'-cyclic-nucleotide 2'-phosphodiesterase (5'-nucleotidase family)